LRKDYNGIHSVLKELEYSTNVEFNLNHGHDRLQFISNGHMKRVDVFLDKFRTDHVLDFRQRIRLDDLTISITYLLSIKLQIVKLGPKDAKDIVAILEDHDL
jgi:hypothetical protein